MISKELLSAVLEVEVENIEIDEEVEYTVLTSIKNGSGGVPYEVYKTEYINIHELAHKCKEWAWNKGYSLKIIAFCVSVIGLDSGEVKEFRYENEDMIAKKPYLPKYEIKACEWILKEIK